jgi:hypothetical protein
VPVVIGSGMRVGIALLIAPVGVRAERVAEAEAVVDAGLVEDGAAELDAAAGVVEVVTAVVDSVIDGVDEAADGGEELLEDANIVEGAAVVEGAALLLDEVVDEDEGGPLASAEGAPKPASAASDTEDEDEDEDEDAIDVDEADDDDKTGIVLFASSVTEGAEELKGVDDAKELGWLIVVDAAGPSSPPSPSPAGVLELELDGMGTGWTVIPPAAVVEDMAVVLEIKVLVVVSKAEGVEVAPPGAVMASVSREAAELGVLDEAPTALVVGDVVTGVVLGTTCGIPWLLSFCA